MPETLHIPNQPAAAEAMQPCASKSGARRHAIAQVACDVFREQGFDAASMSRISERLGGSKVTLHQYFRSKELAAVDAAPETGRFIAPLDEGGDLRTGMTRFARAYLSLRLQPEFLSLDRVLITVSHHLHAAIRPPDPVEIEATVKAVISTFFHLHGDLNPMNPPTSARSAG